MVKVEGVVHHKGTRASYDNISLFNSFPSTHNVNYVYSQQRYTQNETPKRSFVGADKFLHGSQSSQFTVPWISGGG